MSDHHPIIAEDGPGIRLAPEPRQQWVATQGARSWSANWRRVYNAAGCTAMELVG